MVQYRIFTGSLADIEQAFNAWAASLVSGVSINHNPLMAVGDGTWLKEVVYVLPAGGHGVGVPKIAIPRNVN
jgi:hypothetical protein